MKVNLMMANNFLPFGAISTTSQTEACKKEGWLWGLPQSDHSFMLEVGSSAVSSGLSYRYAHTHTHTHTHTRLLCSPTHDSAIPSGIQPFTGMHTQFDATIEPSTNWLFQRATEKHTTQLDNNHVSIWASHTGTSTCVLYALGPIAYGYSSKPHTFTVDTG